MSVAKWPVSISSSTRAIFVFFRLLLKPYPVDQEKVYADAGGE
jgi:hypothetical protein